MTLLEWALTYARLGFPVVPCNPETKRPLPKAGFDRDGRPIEGGIKKATRDEATIRAWWKQWPQAMIAVATGETAGAFVIDIDAGHDDKTGEDFTAEELLRNLENEIGATLVPTWRVRTPRGGWHLYFAYPDAEDDCGNPLDADVAFDPAVKRLAIGNRVDMIERVDVRGNGGYVIAPPSIRSDGVAYTWEIEPSVIGKRPAYAPPALIDCILRRGKWLPESAPIYQPAKDSSLANGSGTGAASIAEIDEAIKRYGDAALGGELREVSGATHPGRNHRLNIAAVKLGGLVKAGALHIDRVEAGLLVAAEACGLIKDDGARATRATIRSGLRKGTQTATDLSHVIKRAEERAKRARGVVRLSGPMPADDAPPPASLDDYGSPSPGRRAEAGEGEADHAHSSQTAGNSRMEGNAALADPAIVRLDERRNPPPPSYGDGDDLTAELIELPETDLGNVYRFHKRYRGRLMYCQVIGWFSWVGTHWSREGADGRVMAAIQRTIQEIDEEVDFIEEHGPNPVVDERKGKPITKAMRRAGWCLASQGASHVNCIEKMARHHFEVQPMQLDADPWKFNTASGTLVIRRGPIEGDPIVRMPHDPADLITKLAPVEYDPDASAPLFDAFLARVQPTEGMRRFLRAWLGYSLTGDVGEQKLVFNWGKGANGKSTLYDVIGRITGDFGKTVPIETFLSEGKGRNAGQATPDLAALPGVRFLRTSEPERNAKMAEALIKLATGGEEMMVRHLHGDYFPFRPAFKLSMSGNYRPQIVGNDDGIWRRMQLVPWEIQIPAEERDKALPDKLWSERMGILNWLLDGLRDYLEKGLIVPDEVTKATADYRSESDPLGRFLEACVITEPGERIQATALHALFLAWAKANGEREWTGNGFGRAMREKGFHSKNSNVNYWLDLRAIKTTADFVDNEGRPIRQDAADGTAAEARSAAAPPQVRRSPGDDEVPF